jgi:hypothetical protein
MEPESSIPLSQVPATCHYPDTDTSENCRKPTPIPHKNWLWNHHYSPHLRMHIQNIEITPVTTQNYI